ncbi:hypothetical protein HTIA_0200 [Halorhabdus tiamatea SARL4B]|nr:hypothetical protein HTIA_0200 [Halorhabdus tiamatea SARL4B]
MLLGAGFGLVAGTTAAGATGVVGFLDSYYRERQRSAAVVLAVGLLVAGGLGLSAGVFTTGITLPGFDSRLSRFPLQLATLIGENALFLGAFGSVTALLGWYGHGLGSRIAGDVPAADPTRSHRGRALSPATVASADEDGRVSIDVTCELAGAKCGPALPTATLDAIESRSWRFPVDLPVDTLETRLAARISTAFGLDVERVSIDQQGRASVAVKLSTSSVPTQLPDGKRAVTVETTIPAGLAPDDRVTLAVEEESVDATVLAVAPVRNEDQSHRGRRTDGVESRSRRQVESVTPEAIPPDRTTAGGNCDVTVAVEAEAVSTVLTADPVTLLVRPSGGNHARGALRQLRRGGMVLRRVRVDEGNHDCLVEHAEDLTVLGVRPPETSDDDTNAWQFRSLESASGSRHDPPSRTDTDSESAVDPRDDQGTDFTLAGTDRSLPPGTELFVIGPDRLLDRLLDPELQSTPSEAL